MLVRRFVVCHLTTYYLPLLRRHGGHDGFKDTLRLVLFTRLYWGMGNMDRSGA
jgi:hypothetical protein